jgi:hypothetical protein
MAQAQFTRNHWHEAYDTANADIKNRARQQANLPGPIM